MEFFTLFDNIHDGFGPAEWHTGKSECKDYSLVVDLANFFGRANEHFCIIFGIVFTAQVGFVPYFPHGNPAFVVFDGFSNIFAPGFHHLFLYKESGSQITVYTVNGIAIAEAHPWANSFLIESVNDFVEPCEIIFPFFLFTFSPSTLDAGIADTELSNVLFIFGKVCIVTVKGLTTDRPSGIACTVGRFSGKLPDL